MNDQERQVIDDIFRRLEQAANQPRDPEAERYIADRIRQQPYAPYVMAQSLYVQEQALERLQAQIQELQSELQHRPQASGGFLSSIFGGGAPAPRQPEPGRPSPWGQAAQQPGPGQGGYPPGYNQPGYGQPGPQGGWGGPQGGPWSGAQPRMGGGFLGSALTTAAGVAGGMMLANALGNAFKGGHETLGSLGGNLGALGADTAAGDGTLSGITDSLYGNDSSGQDASFQDASFPDASFDPDGGFDQDDLGGGSDDSDWT